MAIQMTGIASGLDTQSMINDLMKVERIKVERVENEKTIAEWKKEEWGGVNAKLYSFYKEELFDFKSNGTYQQKMVTSSNESIVSVKNTNTALVGSHSINVQKMAKGSFLTSSALAEGSTASTTARELLGLAEGDPWTDKTINIGVDGVTSESITITEDDTISSIVEKFKNSGLNLNASYDSSFNRIFLSTKDTGEGLQVKLSGDSDLLLENLGFATGNLVSAANLEGSIGQDAVFDYNGTELTSSSNDVSLNGLSFSIRADSGSVNIAATQDTDAIYDKVKAFVLKYNEIADMMNTKLDADSARGYDPLTDEEKEVMSDKDIELWEAKIKDSLLRRDGTLSTLRSDMRNTLTLSQGVTTGSEYKYLSDLGIVTGSYTEKGLLHIEGDEDDSLYAIKDNKLRNAIEDDPEKVMEFLTALGDKLYSNMNDRMKSTTLSSSLTFYEDKAIDQKVKEYDDRIADLEDRLARVEERYYQQFTAMEKAMQQSNSTADWLSQQLAGL